MAAQHMDNVGLHLYIKWDSSIWLHENKMYHEALDQAFYLKVLEVY